MKRLLLPLLAVALCGVLGAQELYMPRNIRKAYENGTRSKTGAPGSRYWQNKGAYDVEVAVDPDAKILRGKEVIKYTNNSPDSLQQLVFNFVNNVHKPNAPRDVYMETPYFSSGLKITGFEMDGKAYSLDVSGNGTVFGMGLEKAFAPGSTHTMKVTWEYPIPYGSGRDGEVADKSFFMAYSYPRISVYDDYNGWDILEHRAVKEFYNDFNDYRFAITVPKNFVVWSTGVFENPQEVLQPEALARYRKSLAGDAVLKIATPEEMKAGKVTAQKDQNTWRFSATHIPDFTFALSNQYAWDASSVAVSGKRVSVQAAYDAASVDFKNYVDWLKYCIKWYSEKWPGVTYPYNSMTAFRGFADMEFPMMINDSSEPENLDMARLTADHETAHTYFPFYMGINESRYAYMDEGWAATLEYLIGIDEHGQKQAEDFYKKFRIERWISDPSAEEDQPLITMSNELFGGLRQ